ncbi:hypothetical protein B0H14DRAFT_2619399 [Mycena olivaceomarginata]|nr:hypothetical protein B0H14DRAFT_2619399 [Mycena olivaceomarginata]
MLVPAPQVPQTLPVLTPDNLRALRISARRASDYVAEADQERVNTRAANIRSIDQEWRDSGFPDGDWCPGNLLTREHAYRVARSNFAQFVRPRYVKILRARLHRYERLEHQYRLAHPEPCPAERGWSSPINAWTSSGQESLFPDEFPEHPALTLWRANVVHLWDEIAPPKAPHLLVEADDAISPYLRSTKRLPSFDTAQIILLLGMSACKSLELSTIRALHHTSRGQPLSVKMIYCIVSEVFVSPQFSTEQDRQTYLSSNSSRLLSIAQSGSPKVSYHSHGTRTAWNWAASRCARSRAGGEAVREGIVSAGRRLGREPLGRVRGEGAVSAGAGPTRDGVRRAKGGCVGEGGRRGRRWWGGVVIMVLVAQAIPHLDGLRVGPRFLPLTVGELRNLLSRHKSWPNYYQLAPQNIHNVLVGVDPCDVAQGDNVEVTLGRVGDRFRVLVAWTGAVDEGTRRHPKIEVTNPSVPPPPLLHMPSTSTPAAPHTACLQRGERIVALPLLAHSHTMMCELAYDYTCTHFSGMNGEDVERVWTGQKDVGAANAESASKRQAGIANSLRGDRKLVTGYCLTQKLFPSFHMAISAKLRRQNCYIHVLVRTQAPYSNFPDINTVLASPQNPKKSRNRRPPSAFAKAAHLETSRKYQWNNEEKLREKSRIRMAARRKAIKDSGEVSEEYANRVKEAHARKAKYLAFKQRLRRQEAFIAKHGNEAYRERTARENARAAAASQAAAVEDIQAARLSRRILLYMTHSTVSTTSSARLNFQ